MALPSWPSTVPYDPDRVYFAVVEPHRPLVVTEVEDGPEIMRAQSQTIIQRLNYRLALTDAEWTTLKAFFLTTLGQGKAHFNMPVLDSPVSNTFNTRRTYLDKGRWDQEVFAESMWSISFTICAFPYSG